MDQSQQTMTAAERHSGASPALALTVLSLADLSVFGLTTAPTPLYAHYRSVFHVGEFGTSIMFVAFAAGSAATLALLGTRLLRQRFDTLLSASYLLAIVAIPCLSAAEFMESLWVFLLGRLLSGVAVGLVASGFTPFAQELLTSMPMPERSKRRWSVIIPSLTMLGLGSGPIVSAVVLNGVSTIPSTYYAAYALMPLAALVLLHVGAGVMSAPTLRDATERKHAHPSAGTQQSGSRTTAVWPLYLLLFLSFSVTGTYGAFSSPIVTTILGTSSVSASGWAAGSAFIAGAIVPTVLQNRRGSNTRTSVQATMRIAIPLLTVSFACLTASALTRQMPLFVCSAILGGGTAGTLFTRTLAETLRRPTDNPGSACARAFCAAYLGLIVPILFGGILMDLLPMAHALGVAMTCILGIAILAACVRSSGSPPSCLDRVPRSAALQRFSDGSNADNVRHGSRMDR